MIDWHEVARNEGIRRLGEVLRRQLNVWTGFLAPSGEVYPIGARQPVDKALCQAFMSRRDAMGSCQRSLRGWIDVLREHEVAPQSPTIMGCHGGLRAVVMPLVLDDEVVGACYTSGFIVASEAEEHEREIFARGKALDLSRSAVSRGCREVTRLTEREVKLVQDLCATMVESALTWVGRLRPEDGGKRASRDHHYYGIIGQSPAMLHLFSLLDKVIESEATVLVQGEPGTGKELVARAIHSNSFRANEAFVVQNCSALNDNLLDSELFGHKRGSFTGAISDKPGLFELADKGTFFLDELGDMSPMLQVKLLRVLQEGTFLPVGDTIMRKVDVRIIAATNRDLGKMVTEGAFRRDLYYRINVITLVVPPLRERMEDIPLLVDHFLDRLASDAGARRKTLTQDALERLMSYDWPGNVRELENELERLVVLSGGETTIESTLVSSRIRGERRTDGPMGIFKGAIPDTLPQALETLERHMILEGLRQTGWNKTQTAKELGVSRRNLIRKVSRYQLERFKPE